MPPVSVHTAVRKMIFVVPEPLTEENNVIPVFLNAESLVRRPKADAIFAAYVALRKNEPVNLGRSYTTAL